ncbi:Glucokinase [bioreactor metagenome]|uniref:Glucokinase n=1 Tax=bioreactor metagenome TaxID=1076179 RepID=A0A644XM19_9ZZZZ
MYAISIDSGGTKVVGAVVDENGILYTKKRYENEHRDGNYLAQTFKNIISQYREEYPVSVVGIGGNGRIDPVKGIILNSGVHINWQGRHLRQELEDCFSLPVSVNNDCYCAIKGEMWKGAAREYSVVAGLIIGTGMGGALAERGKFWHGSNFGAGEVGHMILHKDGLPCYCGQNGCVERYVSGTALWNRYNEAVGENRLDSGYGFFELLKKSDGAALTVMDAFLEDLSVVMANISNLLDPEAILIGGGISETKDMWAEALLRKYQNTVGSFMKDTPIVFASMGNDAALLGAAKFAFEMLGRMDKEKTL